MEENELISLIEKYLDGAASAEERQALLAWYRETDHSRIEIPLEDSGEIEEIRNSMLYKLQQYMVGTSPARKMTWFRWAAAAAILLFIGSGSYFWMHASSIKIKHAGVAASSLKNDLPPGGNKATLTLANGTKIILDSVHNGQLAIQGNNKIIKVGSGLLAYSSQAATHSSPSAEVQYNTLTTPRGGQYRLILPDGSKVWLNAASAITYPTAFVGKERKVEITGEAYFEIATDNQHPFIVSVNKSDIAVLGTHFNVMDYPDEDKVRTTLLQGSIKVSWKDRHVIIEPGQQASFSIHADDIRVERVDTTQVVAWMEGKLSLNDLDVAAIMRKISRWYNVDVTFEGTVPQGHFWGLINRDITLLNMLSILRANGINANLRDNTIIVSDHH